LRPNGVCIPASVFKDNVDDFVTYNIIVQHFLSQEATDDYLRQRRAAGTCRTSHLLNNMVVEVSSYTIERSTAAALAVSHAPLAVKISRSAIYVRLHVTEAMASRTSKRLTGLCSPGSE